MRATARSADASPPFPRPSGNTLLGAAAAGFEHRHESFASKQLGRTEHDLLQTACERPKAGNAAAAMYSTIGGNIDPSPSFPRKRESRNPHASPVIPVDARFPRA
jgi:hypothetical protein